MSRGPGAALLGLALCLVAALFDTPALYVAGAGLMLPAAAAVGVTAAIARTTRVSRSPDRATVEEGAPFLLSLSLSGPLAGLGAASLQAWPGAAPAPLKRGRRQVELEARLPRRGRHRIGPARLLVSDPFGMSARTIESGAAEVLVLPRVEAVARGTLSRISGARRGERSRAGTPRGVAVDADSLQPHRPGAPASRIHWPTVARTGRLHERRLGDDADRRPLIVLDTAAPASEAALDACVRAAASLCRALGERGGCTLLLPGEQRPLELLPGGLRSWPALHARLAVAPTGVAPAAAAIRGAASVLWCSAAREGPDTSILGPGAELIVVTPFPRAGRPLAFAVAGCSAQAVGARASAVRAA